MEKEKPKMSLHSTSIVENQRVNTTAIGCNSLDETDGVKKNAWNIDN